ncbi:MAG: PAS domain-containing sensor histidine kinase [Deltaproteobacteria bacterium]|nr:MAG: PAS domain-containing sensor histidine kinase [Deltaproteobacteria bacterium]
MLKKPTYEELEQRVKELETEAIQRKQAEEDLRDSEEKYRTVLESSPDPIIVYDMDGILIYFNPAFTTVYGLTLEECVGKKMDNFVPDENWPETKMAIDRLLSGESFLGIETMRYTKKGDIRHVSVSGSTYRNSEGIPIGTIVIQRDITEYKKAEKGLRESEERLRAIFEASADPIVVYDNQGYPQYLNPAFTQVFGWTLGELEGRLIPFVPDDEKERISAGIRYLYDNYCGNGEALRVETRRLTKDGRTLDILLNASLIKGDEGVPVGMVVNLSDITEIKRLEAQLQQAQKMEAIGTLAGGIAHDFNNILMGIRGRISLMLMDTHLSRPYFEQLRGMEACVKSATDLTKQLLGFARGGKYEVKPMNLNEIVKKTSDMFGRTRKEINIHRKYQKDIWTAEADQGQIEQVLMNLFINAWQAMPGGGDIYSETENVIVNDDHIKHYKANPGRYVKISVTDTGAGMDEATQQRIFEPFFTTKEMGRGTGLGLASVYGIVKNHKGIINVYSKKGEGTTFNIYLPASESEVIKKRELKKGVLRGSENILLVDDEEMILDVVKEMLNSLGYKVLIATSGKEAIDICKKDKEKIHIVIMDMIMPDMGGNETCYRLKQINPDLKILLSSGYAVNGKATEMLERGCNGFIYKPYNMKQLSEKLREILDS